MDGPALGATDGICDGVALGAEDGVELGEELGAALGTSLGPTLGKELGVALGDVLGVVLLGAEDGIGLGWALGAALCRPVVSTTQALSHVTAVWAMARPTIFPLVPIVIADPARTLPIKILSAPIVRALPRIQKMLSALASP
jgi:hypothetical protein